MAETVFVNRSDAMRQWLDFARRQTCAEWGAAYGFPKSSGIPATARAILDMVPERKTPPLTEKQQQQASGVARAVDRLNSRDLRYGFNEFHP